jgi:hypothetical protein
MLQWCLRPDPLTRSAVTDPNFVNQVTMFWRALESLESEPKIHPDM